MKDKIETIINERAEFECTGGGDYEPCRPVLMNSAELARQIVQALKPELDPELLKGINGGMRARKEGRVKPWGQIKKELNIETPQPGELISDEEIINLVTAYQFSGKQNRHILAKDVAEAQLAHTKYLGYKSPEEVKELVQGAYRDIGESLCNLVGITMLEDMGIGKKLAEQLEGIMKYCQHQAGITFEALKGGSK